MVQRPRIPSQRLRSSPCQSPVSLSTPAYPAGPRKKALLIAINYTKAHNPDHRLQNPQKDVKRLKNLLLNQYGYTDPAIVVMTDEEDTVEDLFPTRDNILREVGNLLKDQESGDQYLFYFAGHTREATDDREPDKVDEFIMPVEAFPPSGGVHHHMVIVDDVLKAHLVDPLLPKSRLIAIFDSCHSRTLLDLPHYRCNKVDTWNSRFRRIGHTSFESFDRLLKSRKSAGFGKGNQTKPTVFCSGFCPRHNGIMDNVISLSACMDSQQMPDHDISSMTSVLIDLLEREQRPTLKTVMRVISGRSLAELKQANPQLSSRYPVSMNSLFKI